MIARNLALAACLTVAACGGQAELTLAATDHSQPGDWTEVHPGLRYESGPVMAAAYLNSERRLSLAGGVVARADLSDAMSAFCEAGLATGYARASVIPMGRCAIEAGPARGFVFPELKRDGGVGFGVGVEAVLARF